MPGALFSDTRTGPAGLVFVSGQVPVDKAGELVVGGMTEQANAVFDRLADRLREHGGSLEQIVKITYFLTDLGWLEEFRQVLRSRLTDPKPAASLVEVSALVRPEFLVEIEAIAVVPES